MIYDIAIIGAGTAGLSAALYARRAGMSSINFESRVHGGMIINTPEVENYPALPKLSGVEFATNLYEQATDFGAEIVYEKVTGVDLKGDIKTVTTDGGKYEAKTVIIATGAKRRKLEIPGEDTHIGRGVSYCATCDGAFFKGKVATVVGGGDSALEDAIYLSAICEKVYLVHRRDSFRAPKITVDKVMSNPKIQVMLNTVPVEIPGRDNITQLNVKDALSGKESSIKTDAVFVAVGLAPDNSMFAGQINLTPDGYIDAGEDCKTNIPGVFVAGDNRKKPLRQLVTAAADGTNAAYGAGEYINSL
jgi:thioredoxin reductase (NADPH)